MSTYATFLVLSALSALTKTCGWVFSFFSCLLFQVPITNIIVFLRPVFLSFVEFLGSHRVWQVLSPKERKAG